nr:hypothetical protein GCM10020185_25560 [Pseudomonas brassicacearum subsp. brassicacearum]
MQEATVADVDNAIQCALNAAPIWQATPPAERAAILERAADLMEGEIQPLMGLLAREAGKTFANAIAEVREAVDFLRYYAVQARNDFTNDAHRPLGPVVCISPWNFPLAIFQRPGRRCPGRRQPGLGQARRADAIGGCPGCAPDARSRHSGRRAATAAGSRRNRRRPPGG